MKFKKEDNSRKLMNIPTSEIHPSPSQPRTSFETYELEKLCESIKENGLLQPITVRKVKSGYELIAGERRLRAFKMAGLSEIPAIVCEANGESAAVFSLIENINRCDLGPFEEAQGIYRLIAVFGMSQATAAAKLGMAQSTLSNKLRILRLSPEQRTKIEMSNLTERHARALLRVPDEKRDDVLNEIIARELNIKETEKLVEEMLCSPQKEPAEIIRRGGIGDVRLFANSLKKIVGTMVDAGYNAKTSINEADSYIEYTVRIEKKSIQMRLI